MAIGGEKLGEAVLELRTDDKRLRTGIDQAEKSARGLSESFRRIGGVIAGAFAGREIFQFAQDAIQAASAVQEMQNLLSVTFGKATSDVVEWSEATAEAVGRSRFELQKFAGDFASFLKPLGTAPEQVAPMSKALTALTVDLASFRNLAEEDVFTKLMSGLAGETEAVRRLGIDLSAAAVEQELLNQGINKSQAEASQADKIMARYAIIMRQTSDAQGDATRTADGFANSQKRLQSQLKELQISIGRQFLPVALDLVGAIAAVTAVLPEAGDGVGVFTKAWVSAHQVVGGAALLIIRAVEGIAIANAKTLELAAKIIPAYRDEAAEARRTANSIGTLAGAFRDVTRDRIDGILEDAAAATSKLGDSVIDVNVNVEGLSSGTRQLTDALDSGLNPALNDTASDAGGAAEAMEELGGAYEGVIDLTTRSLGIGELADDVSELVDQLERFGDSLAQDLETPVEAFEQAMLESIDNITQTLVDGLIDALTSGDTDAAIASFADALGSAVGQAVGASVSAQLGGGVGGAIGGGLAGALTGGIVTLLFSAFTKTGPFREVEIEVNSFVAQLDEFGLSMLEMGENSQVAARSLEDLNAAEAEIFSRLQSSISAVLSSLGATIPGDFEALAFSISEKMVDGVSKGFRVILNPENFLSVGDDGAARTRISGEIERTFETLEEALGFATREFTRNLIDQGVAVDQAVKELAQSDDVPLSVFSEALQRVQGLADQANMSLGGLSALEVEMSKLPGQLAALRGELNTLGISAAQVERLVGGQLVASMQAWRQQITGEELSVEQRRAIAESQRQLFNAELDLRIAELEAKKQALIADAGLTEQQVAIINAGLTAKAGQLQGEGAIAQAGAKLGMSVIDAQDKFLRAKGKLAEGELQLMSGFVSASASIVQAGAGMLSSFAGALAQLPAEIAAQVKAIQAVIDALKRIGKINIGDIRIPGAPRIPSPGSPGGPGGPREDPLEEARRAFNEFLGSLLDNIREQQQLINQLTDELAGLDDFLDNLRLGTGPTPLRPVDQVDELRKRLADVARRAAGGDLDAIREFKNIAATLKQIGADAFGTAGSGFEALLREIEFLGGDILDKGNDLLEDEIDILDDMRSDAADLLAASRDLHDLTQEEIDAIREGRDTESRENDNIREELERARDESRRDLRSIRDLLEDLGRIIIDSNKAA